MAAKSTSASNNLPTREQFVREYMAQLSANRPPKVSLVDRLAAYTEERVVNATKNSQRVFGRIGAAWEISGKIREEAYAREHAKYAEEIATRLALPDR